MAFLPPALLSQLRVALSGGNGHLVTVAEHWEAFADGVRAGTADVVVVDPCADGTPRPAQLAVLLDAYPATPVAIYTTVSALSFRAIAELARHSAHHAMQHVVLHRYDDDPRRFRELLERQPVNALSVALLERLTPALATLPPQLARAVERVIRRPAEFRSVDDIAVAARTTVRTAYRRLANAGFTSPRSLIVGARVLRAYAYARDPRLSLEAIAAKVGYSAPRILAGHMRAVVGVTPRAARQQMRPAEFIDALTGWLCHPMPYPTIPTRRRTPPLDAPAPWARGRPFFDYPVADASTATIVEGPKLGSRSPGSPRGAGPVAPPARSRAQ